MVEEDAKEILHENLQLRELPAEWKGITLDEWDSRTTYGRFLYPFWFLNAALQWISMLVILTIVFSPKLINDAVGLGLAGLSRITPEVYKRE